MHQTLICHSRIVRGTCVVSASGTVLLPARAFANPISEFVTSVSSSPSLSFGCGCALGAVVAGLTVGLIARSTRLDLEGRLTDMMNSVVRAEGAARRAEATLELYERAGRRKVDPFEYVDAGVGVAPVPRGPEARRASHASAAAASGARRARRPETAEASQQKRVAKVAETGGEQDLPKAVQQPRAAQQPKAAPQHKPRTVVAESAHSQEQRSVRETLRERLGRTFAGDIPKIERAPVRGLEDTLEHPLRPEPKREPVRRELDPAGRARIIDRRVPTLDAIEDVPNEVAPAAAADSQSTMAFTAEQIADAVEVSLPQKGDPAMQSYVDGLVREEFEMNRSGAGRRFSRSKLKMIDGAADGARQKGRARHMALATKEA